MMRPPECRVCNKDMFSDDDSIEGGLIYFKKRASDIEWEERMEKTGGVGHPPWADWFCPEHYDKAKELSHLPIDEATKKLK